MEKCIFPPTGPAECSAHPSPNGSPHSGVWTAASAAHQVLGSTSTELSVLVECYILWPRLFFPQTPLELLTTSAHTPLGPSCLVEVSIRTKPEMNGRLSSTGYDMSFRLAGPHYSQPWKRGLEKVPWPQRGNHLFPPFCSHRLTFLSPIFS